MSAAAGTPPTGHAAALGARLAWALTPPSADRRELAHGLLRHLIAPQDPGAVRVARQCLVCGSSHHGAPVLLPGPLPRVSISYAGRLVAVGVAPDAATGFGIDLELDTRETRERVCEALAALTRPSAGAPAPAPAPAATPALAPLPVASWTRLEAIAKARGSGLRGDVTRVVFREGSAGTWTAGLPAGAGGVAGVGGPERPVGPGAGADPVSASWRGADLRVTAAPGAPPAILSLALAGPAAS